MIDGVAIELTGACVWVATKGLVANVYPPFDLDAATVAADMVAQLGPDTSISADDLAAAILAKAP